MLLITDYHEHGSLHDFLKHATLDAEQMVWSKQQISNALRKSYRIVHPLR